ncbi:MAG: ParB/RepB/Spo0J family partition protein [Desulfobacteraceae bacterium]
MNVTQPGESVPIWVDLADIDEKPGPYCMSFGFDLKSLIRSIQRVGLINTPFVSKEKEARIEVVAGYRRILSLKYLNWEKAACNELITDSVAYPKLELLLFNLHDNLATRPFNDVEKGMILSRLALHLSREELLETYMPLLALPCHESTLDLYLRLQDLGEPIKQAFASRRLSLQTIKAFLEMDLNSRTSLFSWISKMKLNFNQQLQLIEYASDISVKEATNIPLLFTEKALSRIVEDQKTNNPQKAKLVLEWLRVRRYPSLTRSEKAFQKRISSLRLPEGVRVSHPPYFEKPGYCLEIFFDNGKALKEKISALSRLKDLEKVGDPWSED